MLPSAVLPALSACTTYAPATVAAVPAGASVRVAVTPEGSAALAPVLGSAVTGLEGEWLGTRGDSAEVRVRRLLTAPGVTIEWSGAAPVTLASGAVRSVERSTVSRGRTALLVGGVAVAAVGFWALLHKGGGAQGEPTGGGSPGF